MWPKTIDIHKNADGIDPVSPIPVRRDDFPGANNSKKKTATSNNGGGGGNISSGRSSSNSTTASGNFSSRNQVSSSSTSKSKSLLSLSSSLKSSSKSKLSKSKFKSSSSSSSRLLLASKQGMELDELKNKYEETQVKMEKMKCEKIENNKRLLEMSGVVKSLQDIPIQYEKCSSNITTTGIDGNVTTSSSSSLDNVQRKIIAIDTEMKKAKKRYDEVRNEKSFQTDTIISQELHIKSMEDQIQLLSQKKVVEEESSNTNINNNTNELEQIIQLQERQIKNLVGEIGELKKDDIVHVHTDTNNIDTVNTDTAEINNNNNNNNNNNKNNCGANATSSNSELCKSLEMKNAAKYSEIGKLEEKLANLREEQNARKIQANNMKSKREEEEEEEDQRRVVDEEQQRLQQLKKMNSQPWNRDLAWKKDILDETTMEENEMEIELVDKIMLVDQSNYTTTDTDTNNSEDNNHDDDTTTTNSLLTLPTLAKRHATTVKSARRKKTSAFGAVGGSISSDRSSSTTSASVCSDQSLDAIFEDTTKNEDKNNNNSDTSVTEGSSTSSLSASPLACDMSSSGEEGSNTYIGYDIDGNPQQQDGSVDCESVKAEQDERHVELIQSSDGSVECESIKAEQDERLVELIQSSDGSVECEGVKAEQDNNNDSARQNENERLTTVLSSSSTEWSSENESSVEYTSGESTQSSSNADYTSCESTQSSSRSVLEQIPEEDDEDTDGSIVSGWGGASIVENLTQSEDKRAKVTTKQQLDNLLLLKQLKESQAKYVGLIEDYNGMVSTSQSRVKTLENENDKLRKDQSLVLSSTAQKSEEKNRCRRLKEENTMLLKNMENQNKTTMKSDMRYEKLRVEHTDTLAELDDKKQRYDQLIMDFSNVADKCKDVENYSRLDALYQAVVMKLGDISEESDKFEQERDEAREQLQKNVTQIEAYDEAIRDLNETESSYKMLQEEHEEAVSQLEKLTKKNEQLGQLYENEIAPSKSDSALQQDYADAMSEMEILIRSNREYAGVESKLNDSEVRVTMLEGEVKISREDLDEAKRKHVERDSQLRDVIAQYKTLKQEHTVKCAKLQRLEMFANDASGDNSMVMTEISALEKELEKSKNKSQEAVKGKQTREDDLRIVLQHYEKLQKKYESTTKELWSVTKKYKDTVGKVEVLERKVYVTKNGPSSINQVEITAEEEEKKEDDGCSNAQEAVVDNDEVADSNNSNNNKGEPDGTLSHDELERQLKECKESSSCKDVKIATTLTELKTMKEYVEKLETDKNQLQTDLSTLKSELLLASREVNNEDERQDSRETQLRTAIANHQQLQKVYASLQSKYDGTKAELEKCKQISKATSVEEQRLRKRAANIHGQYKKLQLDHDVVVERLERLKIEMV